ncbi:MAG TPA: tyrosine-type recombinase/integrase [Polyangia bacterium]|nr:tyrosine-type recombinase/integrase [Polyangia bacterium]
MAFRIGARRRYWRGYATFGEAEKARTKIASDIAAGKIGLEVEKAPVPSLGELFEAWHKRRQKTHRSAKEDRWRWDRHLATWLKNLTPAEVDPALLRRIIEAKLAEGLSSTTVRLLVLQVSGLFSDLVEQGHAPHNPVRLLPRATRRLIRPAHDPRTTPFLERKEDVRRVYLGLPEPINVAFALGAFAGLRTGETLGLRWEHVDLVARRIHVRESVGGPLKDDESRVVPILDSLLSVLKPWKLKTGGQGTVVPPMRSDGRHCDDHTLRSHLGDVLRAIKLLPANDTHQDAKAKRRPRLNWYRCTRHTFASHWVMDGRPIEMLKEILGHSTVQITERYAHLRVDLFRPEDLAAMSVDLSPVKAEVTGAVSAERGLAT